MDNNQLANRPADTGIDRVRNYIMSEEVRERFTDMMGRNGVYYLNQVLIVVSASPKLQECSLKSIFISAMRAASLRLSVDPSQGQAWIIPYKGIATFQIGYRGIYELAMRTNQYRYINVAPVYEGEIVEEDRMTGIHSIAGKRTGGKVIGWMLYFELLNGYKKTYYMTVEEIEEHAKRYSQSYSDDRSKWHDPRERPKMEKKTVLSNGLRKWGRFNQNDIDALNEIEESTPWNGDIPDEGDVTPPVNKQAGKTVDQLAGELGFDAGKSAPKPAPVEPISTADLRKAGWTSTKMTWDMAASVVGKTGERYVDLSNDELRHRADSIQKILDKNHLKDEDRADLTLKRDTALACMEADI